jgi:hypothetical protein
MSDMKISELIHDLTEMLVSYGDCIVTLNDESRFAEPEAWMMADDILCLSADADGWSAPHAEKPKLTVVS